MQNSKDYNKSNPPVPSGGKNSVKTEKKSKKSKQQENRDKKRACEHEQFMKQVEIDYQAFLEGLPDDEEFDVGIYTYDLAFDHSTISQEEAGKLLNPDVCDFARNIAEKLCSLTSDMHWIYATQLSDAAQTDMEYVVLCIAIQQISLQHARISMEALSQLEELKQVSTNTMAIDLLQSQGNKHRDQSFALAYLASSMFSVMVHDRLCTPTVIEKFKDVHDWAMIIVDPLQLTSQPIQG